MIDESEIRLAAEQFVDRCGKDAPHQASIRARELRAAGHVEEYDIWISIYREATARRNHGWMTGRKSAGSRLDGRRAHIMAGRTARIGVYSVPL